MMAALNSSRGSIPLANYDHNGVYPLAIIMPLLSFLLILLVIPPAFWHARNQNIGAAAFIFWLLLLLSFNFINALIWPSDNMSSWFDGVGLCDIEVKILVASQVAFPVAFACILRPLAAVMDTKRTTITQTQARRRRAKALDFTCSIGLPLLQMPLHYIVQGRRYFIYGIAGCTASVTPSWLTIPLLIVPPMLWTLFDAYLATLILIRLYRYRLSFNTIIASSNTTKSRFIRLYALCILWVVVTVPLQLYTVATNTVNQLSKPFSWSAAHNANNWDTILMIPSQGTVSYDRWVWLAAAFAIFLFFGLGREATTMYRNMLLSVGAARLFPSLKDEPRTSITSTISSFGSRAKMLFRLTSMTSADSQTTLTSAAESRKSGYHGEAEEKRDGV